MIRFETMMGCAKGLLYRAPAAGTKAAVFGAGASAAVWVARTYGLMGALPTPIRHRPLMPLGQALAGYHITHWAMKTISREVFGQTDHNTLKNRILTAVNVAGSLAVATLLLAGGLKAEPALSLFCTVASYGAFASVSGIDVIQNFAERQVQHLVDQAYNFGNGLFSTRGFE